MADICVFRGHLFPRKTRFPGSRGHAPHPSAQKVISIPISFFERGFPPLFLLMFKISQHSLSLRTEYNFNTIIISPQALQPLTNVLSSSRNVLSSLLRQREHGEGRLLETSTLEELLCRQEAGTPSLTGSLPSRLCCPMASKPHPGPRTLLTKTSGHDFQPRAAAPSPCLVPFFT